MRATVKVRVRVRVRVRARVSAAVEQVGGSALEAAAGGGGGVRMAAGLAHGQGNVGAWLPSFDFGGAGRGSCRPSGHHAW